MLQLLLINLYHRLILNKIIQIIFKLIHQQAHKQILVKMEINLKSNLNHPKVAQNLKIINNKGHQTRIKI
jgi:hypothetical protein